MKKKNLVVFILVCLMLCQGCVLVSDEKYQAEKEMWKAKQLASIAWANQANMPLATFKTANGEVFTVNNPNRIQPMAVVGEPSAMVQALNVVLNSKAVQFFSGGWAAGYVAGKIKGNSTTYTASGEGAVIDTSDHSSIVTTTKTAVDGGAIKEEQHTDSDNATDNREDYANDTDNRSDYDNNTDNRTDYDNATATPTVVEQPPPVVIQQPEPIVITQPATTVTP